MAEDVFISYCHENKEAARILAATVEAKGYTVWWDHELVAGDNYAEVIEQRLDSAKAIIVIWSEHSRKSHWVRDEAAVGRDRNRLLPVAIDGNLPPLGFRQIQTIDLKGWDGKDPARIGSLLMGLANLVKTADPATAMVEADAASTRAFGAATGPSKLRDGKVAAGVNVSPNNKSVKLILKEEKKQRSFFRTYFLTSFLLSALLAGALGAYYVQSEGLSDAPEAGDAWAYQVGELIGAFLLVGFGLFLGRFLIIIGRRLSKRKSIRYFDSVTLIVMSISVGIGVLLGWANTQTIDGAVPMGAIDSLVLGALASIGIVFPIVALFSVPIGFFKGLGRTNFEDGK